MPVTQCPNGKWKIGSGSCRYSTKEKAEKAWAAAKASGAKSTAKYGQEEAGYRIDLGVRGLQCGECLSFSGPEKVCAIVSGIIDVGAICNFFDPAANIGDMPTVFAKSKPAMFDMFITKASQDPETGEKRWAAVASDTDLDSYNDQMSIMLYEDFIHRIETEEIAPAVFTSEAWQGGMPYLGLSHYLDLNGAGIVGTPVAVYVDGNRLKAKGTFEDTPLGEAGYKAVKLDQKNNVDPDDRIRISIAFVDWEHAHGDEVFTRESLVDECLICARGEGDMIYRKGQLVHLALTRVPVNDRTPIWLEERAMATMKEDALSVLGEEEEELVENIDKLAKKDRKILRSQAVVIKSDEEEVVAEGEAEAETPEEVELVGRAPLGGATDLDSAEAYLKSQEKMWEIWDVFYLVENVMINISEAEIDEVPDKPAAINTVISQFKERVDETVKRSLAKRAATLILESETEEGEPMAKEQEVVVEKEIAPEEVVLTPLDTALAKLKAAVVDATGADGDVDEQLKALQPVLNDLVEVVKSQVKGEDIVQSEAVAKAVAEAVGAQLAPLTEALTLLAAKSQPVVKSDDSMIPGPRAFIPPPAHLAQEDKPKSSLTQMIRRSVGIVD